MSITPFTVYPQSTDPEEVFSNNGDIWIRELSTQFIPQANELEENVNAKEISATNQAAIATIQAGLAATNGAEQVALATNQAILSTTQANIAIASSNYKGDWESLSGELYKPAAVSYEGNIWLLKNNLEDVTAIEPIEGEDWTMLKTSYMETFFRTGNIKIGHLDRGKIINITSGTFSQDFESSNFLGVGWFCYLKNSGLGDITLNPSGLETIDGLDSFVMYPGECRLIMSDGINLTTIVINSFYKTFIESGSFIKPPGYSRFFIIMWSGGHSGKNSGSLSASAYGGAGGGCGNFYIPSELIGSTETVFIGSGGAPSTSGKDGKLGGNTSLGDVAIVYAGKTYTTGGSVIEGATTSSVSVSNYEGQRLSSDSKPSFWGGGAGNNSFTGDSANTWYGGAAGGSVSRDDLVISMPGVSKFGGDGGYGSVYSDGGNGEPRGGGGGATLVGTLSGGGGRGELRIGGII